MTITLYKIKDDARVVNKTLNNSTKIAEITAHYKSDVDILNPVLEIAYNASYTEANYFEVSDWGRKYFVKNITTGSQRLYIEGAVDVLTTYKTDIEKLRVVVERQEKDSNANKYLPDGMFRATARQIISTPYKLGQGFSKDQSIIMTTGGRS